MKEILKTIIITIILIGILIIPTLIFDIFKYKNNLEFIDYFIISIMLSMYIVCCVFIFKLGLKKH